MYQQKQKFPPRSPRLPGYWGERDGTFTSGVVNVTPEGSTPPLGI